MTIANEPASGTVVVPASAQQPENRRRKRRSRSEQSRQPTANPLLLNLAMYGVLALALLGPYMTFSATNEAGMGSVFRQAGYIFFALVAAFAVRVDKDLRRLLVVPWPLVLALAWCWLSLAWALAPGVALRRVFLTSLVIWTLFLLVRRMGYAQALTAIRISLVVLLAVNFLTVYFYPDIGIHQFEIDGDEGLLGDWRGIVAHKNAAGLVCALTILCFVFDAAAVNVFIRLGVIGGSAFFLVQSSSRTSLAVCAATLVLGWLFSAYKYRYRPVAFALIIVLIAAGAVVQNMYHDPFLRTLNDPAAFTGRTQIWNAVWAYYRNHPLFGAGFGSFWDIGPASPILMYGRDWVTQVTQSHNGYLDLLLQVGPIGVGLIVFAVAVVPFFRLLNSRRLQGQTGALLMATIVFCLGHNMTETSLFDRDSIGQVFMVLALALLWRADTARGKQTESSVDLLSWANRDRPLSQPDSAPAQDGERRRRRRRSRNGQ